MAEVGILEAKTHFSTLVAKAERGEETIITRHGKPVAKISSLRRPGSARRLTGAELVARSQELQARIARESPAMVDLTWDDLKKTAYE